MATPTNSWSAPSPHAVAQPAGGEEMGAQARPMGLKVHYTFDRDNIVNCLARWPHVLHIQTIPLDERNSIGVIDLRTCLQAVAQCSPEIVNQHDTDYSVYAYDYSEPDLPLVGQGMLSWGLDVSNDMQPQPPKLVTGRVTRNLLAILSNGSRETLEVKLKLTAVQKMMRNDFSAMDGLPSAKSALIPADTSSEWNSFIQSTSMFGHTSNVASMPSPSISSVQMNHFNASMGESMPIEMRSESRPMDMMSESRPMDMSRSTSVPPIPPRPSLRPNSMPPQAPYSQSLPQSAPSPAPPTANTPAENAPSPAAPQPAETAVQGPASRSTSRARRSRKAPTGRPRGRPRKQAAEGNTSAAEDFTDGDEGPQKKRAKVTRTEYNVSAPFGSAPESLRVAASTSGSLRSFRPVGSGTDAPNQNHLQEVPRAPTPVPDGATLQQQQRRWLMEHKARSEAQRRARQQSQDVRSPAESFAPSPDQAYTPEDSPGDLGSSPPVPRTSAYMNSSPPASSPILPPMPMPQVDSGFMSGGLDDFFDEDDLMQDLPPGHMSELPGPMPGPAVSIQPVPAASKPRSRKKQQKLPDNYPFQEVTPGPPELLPQKSIFKPAGKVISLNRSAPPPSSNPVPKKSSSRSLKRSNTAPVTMVTEHEASAEELPAVHQLEMELDMSQDHAQLRQLQEHLSLSNGATPSVQELKEEVGNGPVLTAQPIEPQQQPQQQLEAVPTTAATLELPDPLDSFPIPPRPESRPASRPPSRPIQPPTVPASDPVPEPPQALAQPFMSEATYPTSDFEPRYNKNMVKKQSIKERLETAIQKGESPPFCNNCGAIETPTWRKIWTQDHKGIPGFHEFSDKPGYVTMIDILERDSEGQPSTYRLVKKNLGAKDEKRSWNETLLCNPCGIWLAKFKTHRPPDRWDKDAARLNQPRKKREPKGSRTKKSRTKSDAQLNPTSEAYFMTDPLGPMDQESPDENNAENELLPEQTGMATIEENILNLQGSPKQRLPGSTHSRGSGTADSPIAVEDGLGSTRRLLFPSPKREGASRVLGELAVNVLQTATNAQVAKSADSGKENARPERPGTPVHDALDQELFGTPPDRPSTPPPKSAGTGPFKTPTRPTPSHRPITRSISKSMQSSRSIPKSPAHMFAHLQRTPSRTPRSGAHSLLLSASRRRSPRNGHLHAHFAPEENLPPMQFDSPFTATLHQLLSEANEFTAGSPSHGLTDLDLNNLPQIDSDGINHLANTSLDFANFLSTDMIMPSSPPLLRHRGGDSMDFGGALSGGNNNA
ncbi:CENP-A multicopy suppressor protein 2 [Cladorrhinum sp. PSN332]|nr:CENP-A multicopy suppressor protein 2 [Cladorrhinum sp. PSN332]